MGSLDEDLLDVRSHFRVAEDLVTFINDEELALVKVDKFVFSQIDESSGGSNDNVRVFLGVAELRDVVFERNTTEIGTAS